VACIWICSLSIAYFVGHLRGIDKSELSTDNNLQDTIVPAEQGYLLQRKITTTNEMLGSKVSLELAPVENEQGTVASIANLVNDIQKELSRLEVGYSFESIAASYQIVKDLSETELAQALEHLTSRDDIGDYEVAMQLLLERYAGYSPVDAINYASSIIGNNQLRRRAITKVLGTWSASDPITALNWYQQQERESGIFSIQISTIFRGLAERNVDLAMSSLSEISHNKIDLHAAISGIASKLDTSDGFKNLLERTSSLDNERFTKQIYNRWALQDGEGLNEYIESLENPKARSDAMEFLFQAYVNNEKPDTKIASVADAYVAEANSDEVDKRVKTMMQQWGGRNPQAALNWINQKTGIDHEKATYELVRRASSLHPDFAIRNLSLVPSGDKRTNLSVKIYLSLKRKHSQQKADSFLQSLPDREVVTAKIADIDNRP